MSYIGDLRNTYLKDEYKHIAIQGNGTGLIIYRRTMNKELEVLAQVRGDVGKRVYSLFGGGIENLERYIDCAVRELHEEIGLMVKPEDLHLMEVYAGPEHVTHYPSGDVVVHTVVVYAVDYDNVAGDIKEDGVETLASTWLTEHEIRQLLENAEDNFFHNNIPIFRDIVERFSKVLRRDIWKKIQYLL